MKRVHYAQTVYLYPRRIIYMCIHFLGVVNLLEPSYTGPVPPMPVCLSPHYWTLSTILPQRALCKQEKEEEKKEKKKAGTITTEERE